jgi:C4-dicarboxylate-binding protein DctP
MRKSIVVQSFLLGALLVFSASAVLAQKPELKIRLPHITGPSHPVAQALVMFKDIVGKDSEGKIAVNIFPAAQLGTDIETYEMASAGFMEAATGSWSNIGKLTPAFEPFGLPYLFESKEQYLRVLSDEKVLARTNAMLEKINLHWASTMTLGLRSIGTTNKKINSPADLKGVKLRVTQSLTDVAALKAFGASGVAVPWSETYDALKTGVVDGEAIAMDAYVSARHHEVLKYISTVNYQAFSYIVVFNKKWWDGVKPEYKKIITSALARADKWHADKLSSMSSNSIKTMRKARVEIFRPAKYDEFVKLGKATWPQFYDSICPKDYVDLIIDRKGPKGDGGWGSWGGEIEE